MMNPSRRLFLESGLGACAASAMVRPMTTQCPVGPYYKAVFDERFEAARVFAAEAAARRIPTAAIRGDITRLFFDDLDRRWKRGPVWLVGWTTPASLFCLELLARDRGMRLRHGVINPGVVAAVAVLDGALTLRPTTMRLGSSDPAHLAFWIIAPKETAHA